MESNDRDQLKMYQNLYQVIAHAYVYLCADFFLSTQLSPGAWRSHDLDLCITRNQWHLYFVVASNSGVVVFLSKKIIV